MNYETKQGHFFEYWNVILVYIWRWSYGRFQDDNNIFHKMKNDLTNGTWQDDMWCPINIILLCTSDVWLQLNLTWLLIKVFIPANHVAHSSSLTPRFNMASQMRVYHKSCWTSWTLCFSLSLFSLLPHPSANRIAYNRCGMAKFYIMLKRQNSSLKVVSSSRMIGMSGTVL